MADYGIRIYPLRGSHLSRAFLEHMTLEGETLRASLGVNENASVLFPALDGVDEGYAWGRLALQAELGPEAVLTIRVMTSDQDTIVWHDQETRIDEILLDPQVPLQEKDRLFLLGGGSVKSGARDVLLDGQQGRFLWIWAEVTGEGVHSLQDFRVYVPAEQFYGTLPEVYQEDNSFLRRYLAIFSTMYQEFQERINALPEMLDADTAPEELLPVFTSWLGLEIDEALFTPQEVRTLLKAAPQLMERKGTKWAIETAVKLFISEKVYVVEQNMLQADQMHSEKLYGTTPYDFSVMIGRKMDEKTRLRVQFLIDQFKPIRSRYRIVFLEDCGGLDSFTYLDINGTMLQNAPGNLDDGKALTGMTYLE